MDDLFTRDEVLGGLPAKRANTSLFLIERRTCQRIALSHQASHGLLEEQSLQTQELAFIEAFTLGRDAPERPTIQDLERYAPQWADLVPRQNPRVQAAIAHLLGQRYRFQPQQIPRIRAVLELDEPAVQTAYERLYQQSLTAIYAQRLFWSEQLTWAYAALSGRIEDLPPFWLVVIFTVTANFSQGALALPIATASIGPLPGLILLGGLGLVNVLTIAAMAEAATRSGAIRYGNAFLGRLVTDFLGKEAAAVLSLAVITLGLLGLAAATLGLSVTLQRFTQLPATLWVGVILAIVLVRLWREGRKFGVMTMMVLGALSLILMVILGGLALTHLQPANLYFVQLPWQTDAAFDLTQVAGLIGGILVSFQGSSRVPHCAKLILPRDPSGRSLIWGSVVGTILMVVLLGFWLVAVSGAVGAAELAGQRGTALDPLVPVLGPVVTIVGAVMVCLLLGLAALRTSDMLFNLVRERLPNPSPLAQVLQLVQSGQTEASAIASQIGGDGATVRRLLSQLQDAGLIALPKPPLRAGARSLRRRAESEDELGAAPAEEGSPPPAIAKSSRPSWFTHPLGRFLVCASPTIAVVILTEGLLLAGFGSFSKILSVIGIVSVSLISGIFPVLLLLSSRRKGEIPSSGGWPGLGQPVVLGLIYGLFVAILLSHGLVIWQNWLERILALTVAVLTLGVTVVMVRQGAFRSRLVIELREDQRLGEQPLLRFTACGRSLPLAVTLVATEADAAAAVETVAPVAALSLSWATRQSLRITQVPPYLREFKVWLHQIHPDGHSEGQVAQVQVSVAQQTRTLDLEASTGQAVVQVPQAIEWIQIDWPT